MASKRKWLLVTSDGKKIGHFTGKTARAAAVKAASKGHEHIHLVDPKKPTAVKTFKGWYTHHKAPAALTAVRGATEVRKDSKPKGQTS